MAGDLYAALKSISSHGRIGAASVTSYDPESDRSGSIPKIIERAAAILAG